MTQGIAGTGMRAGAVLKTLALALAAGLWTGAAAAAVTYSDCVGPGYDLSTAVTGTVDCEVSSARNDNPAVNPVNGNPATVNRGGGFFDITSWEYEGRTEYDPMASSGSYDLTALFAGFEGEIMLVFKGGLGQLTAFLLDTTQLAGTWTAPFDCSGIFACSPLPNGPQVRHISIYTTPAPIPLPASGLMLAGVIGAVGLARRRRA
jgi:hypothetical protein